MRLKKLSKETFYILNEPRLTLLNDFSVFMLFLRADGTLFPFLDSLFLSKTVFVYAGETVSLEKCRINN